MRGGGWRTTGFFGAGFLPLPSSQHASTTNPPPTPRNKQTTTEKKTPTHRLLLRPLNGRLIAHAILAVEFHRRRFEIPHGLVVDGARFHAHGVGHDFEFGVEAAAAICVCVCCF